LHELLEDYSVGDAGPVTIAERMAHITLGQQGGELFPEGSLR
jgi:hypothetical protein